MNLSIRKAIDNDIEAIVFLNSQLADYHRKIDDYYKTGKQVSKAFKNYLQQIINSKNHLILIAQNDNLAIGYFIGEISPAKPFLTPEKTGRISDAFVVEKYRGRGLGEKLFDKMLQWFDKHNVAYIELSVDVRNQVGIRAWQKYGFEAFMLKMKRKL